MVIQSFENIVVAADATFDIWSVLAVSPNKVKLHAFELTSNAIASTLTRILLRRITAVGSGGSLTGTEELLDDDIYSARTATVRTLDTTEGTGGGDLMGFQWEQLGAIGHIWTPETRPVADLTDGFALTSRAAIGFNASGFLIWEEM